MILTLTITIAAISTWLFLAKISYDSSRDPDTDVYVMKRVLTNEEIKELYNNGKSVMDEATTRMILNSTYGVKNEAGMDMHIHHQEYFDQLIITPMTVEPVMVTYTVWGHKTTTQHGHN